MKTVLERRNMVKKFNRKMRDPKKRKEEEDKMKKIQEDYLKCRTTN